MTKAEGPWATLWTMKAEIESMEKSLLAMKTEYRKLSGWHVPSFRAGTAAAIIMARIKRTGSLSVADFGTMGLKSTTGHHAVKVLMDQGYIMRDGIGLYRKKENGK